MDITSAMRIVAGGLSAQRTRMNVIAENMANAQTTRTAEGGPYRRGQVVLGAVALEGGFADALNAAEMRGVETVEVARDDQPPRMVSDPDHPDAVDGMVAMPNVSLLEETTDMMSASRAYEANLGVLRTLRTMAERALGIGRG